VSDKEKALELALGQIERQFGRGSIMRLGEVSQRMHVEAIPTGSISLDLALGIGGIPRGRISEIFGAEITSGLGGGGGGIAIWGSERITWSVSAAARSWFCILISMVPACSKSGTARSINRNTPSRSPSPPPPPLTAVPTPETARAVSTRPGMSALVSICPMLVVKATPVDRLVTGGAPLGP